MKWYEKIKERRIELGLTQNDIACAVGISRGRYANYELGDRQPDFDVLALICHILGLSSDYILGLEDKTGKKTSTYNNYGTHNGDVKF